MKHALILNVLIITLVGLALFLTREVSVLFALFLLRDMPYGLLVGGDEPDDETKPIGFTAKIEPG